MTARQGDVLLVPVHEIPAGLVAVPLDCGRVVLAYGEVTGHAHVIDRPDVVQFLAADLDEMSDRFLRVEQEVKVVHDEHDPVVLAPGDYRVVRQREYTPERIIRVAD